MYETQKPGIIFMVLYVTRFIHRLSNHPYVRACNCLENFAGMGITAMIISFVCCYKIFEYCLYGLIE